MTTFGEIRQGILKYWLAETGRRVDKDHPLLNDYNDSRFECAWQAEVEEGKHVSFFCSLGDSSSSLTDWLTDERYDAIEWGSDTRYDEALLRHYRILLLLAEGILLDLVDLYAISINSKHKKTRAFFAKKIPDFNPLISYVNTTCKHRVQQGDNAKQDDNAKRVEPKKLHACNHHLPIFFVDSGGKLDNRDKFIRVLYEGETGIVNPRGIEVPSLEFIFDVIIGAYDLVDNEFMEEQVEKKKKEASKTLLAFIEKEQKDIDIDDE